MEEALRKAIHFAGSQQQLAWLLGISRAVVNNWLNGGINVPLKYALHIEVLTQGLVKAEELVPSAKKEIIRFQKYILQHFA